jgi:single-stranded DNA-binding protein
MNHTILIGCLGKDPVERVTKNGKKAVFFSLAVDHFTINGKVTQWYNIAVWDEKLFPMVSSLHKGSYISVAGSLSPPEVYETKNGDMKADLTLHVCAIYFVRSGSPSAKRIDTNSESADYGDFS